MTDIALLLADVDGTLVTHDKVLTERAIVAVQKLAERGIRFAITSGRPPKGMSMLFAPLKIETPIAGFNGGLFTDVALKTIEEHSLPTDVAKRLPKLSATINSISGYIATRAGW